MASSVLESSAVIKKLPRIAMLDLVSATIVSYSSIQNEQTEESLQLSHKPVKFFLSSRSNTLKISLNRAVSLSMS